MASLVETAFQTMFILDASRRSAATPDHIRKKPGRELVTFLLVSNLAMWAINTLEKSRAESHPLQLHFYGLWAWTIITHVSMPLGEEKHRKKPKLFSNYNFPFQRFSTDFTARFVCATSGSVHGKWNQLTCKHSIKIESKYSANAKKKKTLFVNQMLGVSNKAKIKRKSLFNLQPWMMINNFFPLLVNKTQNFCWLNDWHIFTHHNRYLTKISINNEISRHNEINPPETWDQFL